MQCCHVQYSTGFHLRLVPKNSYRDCLQCRKTGDSEGGQDLRRVSKYMDLGIDYVVCSVWDLGFG